MRSAFRPRRGRRRGPRGVPSRHLGTARTHSGANTRRDDQDKSRASWIPAPTWSVASLRLDAAHPPVANETLQVLCQRSLLDVERLDDRLAQDLGNMVHMMATIDVAGSESTTRSDATTMSSDRAQRGYDLPRHATGRGSLAALPHDAPARHQETAALVWKSFLAPHTQRVGAHSYFVLPTGHPKKKKDDDG